MGPDSDKVLTKKDPKKLIKNHIGLWKQKLIDFSKRNQLLYFRPKSTSSIEITEASDEIFRKLVIDNETLLFKDMVQAFDTTEFVDMEGGSENTSDQPGAQISDDQASVQSPEMSQEKDSGASSGASALKAEPKSAFSSEIEEDSFSDFEDFESGFFVDPGLDPGFDALGGEESDLIDLSNRAYLQTNKDDRSLQRALKNIRIRAKSSLNEQGVNILFLSLCFLEWFDKSNNDTPKSPLILLPVSIERKGLNAPFEISLIDDEIILNPTLSYKLQHDYGVKLPDLSNYNLESLAELSKLIADIEEAIAEYKSQSWKVIDESAVGLFSFAKLSMYKDMEENEDKLVAHPLVRQICGAKDEGFKLTGPFLKDKSGQAIEAKDIDKKIDANKAFQVLDADSSQQEAIYAARAGESFVLQGPPGTGKSQTITNIISESLAQNKKILFVSEKKAALDVVFKRLTQSSLDKFCLVLHGSKQKKSEVISGLRTSLEEIKELAMSSTRFPYIENINELKQEISKGIDDLHKIRQPINLSLYEIYGELAQLQQGDCNDELFDDDRLDFTISNIESLSPEKLSALDFLFIQLEKKEEVLNDYPNFVWKNASPNNLSFELEMQIKSKFTEFKDILGKLKDYANPISERYFGKEVDSIKQFKWLKEACDLAIDSPFPKQDWFDKNKLEEVSKLAVEGKKGCDLIEAKKSDLLSKYDQSFWALDHRDLLQKFTTEYVGVFKFLNIGYWQSLGKVKKASLFNETRELSLMVKDLESALELTQQSEELDSKEGEIQLALGDFYQRFDTNWEETINAVKWVKKVINKLEAEDSSFDGDHTAAGISVSKTFLSVVSDDSGEGDFEEFKEEAAELIKAWDVLKHHIDFYKSIFNKGGGLDINKLSFEELQEHLEDLITNISKIEDWIEFKKLRDTAEKSGLRQFIDVMLNNPSSNNAKNLKKKFYKKFYQLWIDKIEIESSSMRSFSGKNQDVLIEKFIDLDLKQMAKVRADLAKKLSMSWIEYASKSDAQDALQVLNAEVNKKKRHKPIRKLIKEIPDLLLTLKPCWMMSPLSASQFIDQNLTKFDIVIFDEASQIRTEDAICSVVRGSQLVLAGDSKQLPPTDFFNISLSDIDGEFKSDDDRDFESVLDQCSVFMKSRTLNWHYRSRHESLISFSNENIYDNKLISFPSPIKDSPDFGVHFELVEDGTYERGARYNRRESKRVAEAVIEHFQANPNQSLGVIAFSEAQQMSIEREIEAIIRKSPGYEEFFSEDQEEAFFVKNLENVQGDERDVIFFSIGYAKDKKGVLSHNFGPLNKEGGHRRLNVAVTRAKDKLKVFSSILSSDIDLNRTSSEGAALLKKYLEYAQSSENGLLGNSNDLAIDNHSIELLENNFTALEESIAKALEAKGYSIKKYLGSSNYRLDLAVYKDDEFLLALETDGYMYQSANTARDRERLRRQVLHGLGWKVHRVYGRDWIREPQKELDKILNRLA